MARARWCSTSCSPRPARATTALSEALDRRSVLAAAALPYALRRQPAYYMQLAGVALPRVPFDAVQKAPGHGRT